MTSKQRILAALRGEPVDRPAAMPDFYMMFPARFAGKTMWELVGPRSELPIHLAQLQAYRHFGLDAWLNGAVSFPSAVEIDSCDRTPESDPAAGTRS